MKLPIYQVDAFTSTIFGGNPAAVCVLDSWLHDDILQSIASENNLSETAFLVPAEKQATFDIRWFTPVTEVALCGHATLASGFVLFECRRFPFPEVVFRTQKSGRLRVLKREDSFELDFPARKCTQQQPPPGLVEATGIEPAKVLAAEEDFMLICNSEHEVRQASPDFVAISKIECRGVIVSAPGTDCDFVSRFFALRFGINEDPVTGSAHCALIPYWSEVLGKQKLTARQVSRRGGELFCENRNDRVGIRGKCVLYLEGAIEI